MNSDTIFGITGSMGITGIVSIIIFVLMVVMVLTIVRKKGKACKKCETIENFTCNVSQIHSQQFASGESITLDEKESVSNHSKLQESLLLKSIKEKLTLIDPRVKNINFFSNSEEAYTLNKKEIHMCLMEPSGKYYSDNVLIYIALHELAHVILPFDTSNHPPIFDQIFNQLQEKAISLGLYDPSIPFPDEYCGKKISYY